MVSLVKTILRNNNFLSMFGNVVFAGLSFISFALLARSYTPDVFGKYMLFIAGGTFIEMLRFGLTRTSIVKFLMVSSDKERKSLVGSSYLIGFAVTVAINLLILAAALVLGHRMESSSFNFFLKWYPLMALANLPMNNAISLMLAKERFDRLLLVRIIASGSFLAYVVVNFFSTRYDMQTTVIVQICSQLLASLICMGLGWDGIRHIRDTTRASLLKLLHFGKYSMGTLISTSLLKSADIFILGLLPVLGINAVALYSIPLKLSELLEIPLRSFAATIYPKMARASHLQGGAQVSVLYYNYTGMLFYFFIPLLLFCEVFAHPLVLIFGGAQYIAAVPIFRLYMLYGLFLPFDRLTGVGLDAVGQPKYNLYKVFIMATVNIVGDIIAILVFNSLYAVAMVTIINTFIGAFIGYRILGRHIPLRFKLIFIGGWKLILTKRAIVYEQFLR